MTFQGFLLIADEKANAEARARIRAMESLEMVSRQFPTQYKMPTCLLAVLCMVDGKTDKQIAASLNLSQKTVGHHVRALLVKLEAKNRTQAVVKALSMELINIQLPYR